LSQEEGVDVNVTTLRRWLIGAGWWERRRKRRVHRRRRERRACWGELLQLDGSHHDWFEGRRLAGQPAWAREIPYAGWAVLMVLIDDATGRVLARFYEHEARRTKGDGETERAKSGAASGAVGRARSATTPTAISRRRRMNSGT